MSFLSIWSLVLSLTILVGIFILVAGENSDEEFNYYNYHEPIGERPCLKHGSRCNVIHNEATAACCNSNPIYPPCYDFKFITGQCRWVMCRYPNGQNTYLKYCLHWNYFKYNFKWTGDSHRSSDRLSYNKQINPAPPEEVAARYHQLQQDIIEQHKKMEEHKDIDESWKKL